MMRDSRRRSGLRGRHWLLLGLFGFLVVAIAVLARQQAAMATALRLRGLRERHAALEAVKAGVERTIRTRAAAATLLPRLAPTGLALPADTAYTILTVEQSRSGARR